MWEENRPQPLNPLPGRLCKSYKSSPQCFSVLTDSVGQMEFCIPLDSDHIFYLLVLMLSDHPLLANLYLGRVKRIWYLSPMRSLARTSAARSYKQLVKRNLQTESQIPGPIEWLGMRS